MATSTSDEPTRLCSSCEESIAIDLLYRCTPCNMSDDPKKPVDFLCDHCVVLHIKKGHNVLDHRSMEPAVCPDHKQLCSHFCIDCGVVFCVKCLEKHCKHDFQSLNEKASELRAKLFDLMTDWEKKEKVALQKSEDVSGAAGVHENEVEQMIQEVESTLNNVEDTLIAEIRSKLAEFSDKKNWLEDHVQKVGKTQKDMRSLLCQSNGTLVTSFPAFESEVGLLSTSHSEVEQYQMNEEKFETREEIKFLNQKFVAEVRKKLNLPDVKKENPGPSVVKKSQPKKTPGVKKTNESSSELRFKSIVGCFTKNCYEVSQRAQYVVIRKYDTRTLTSSSEVLSQDLESDAIVVNQVFIMENRIIIVTSGPHETENDNIKRAFRVYCGNRTPDWEEIPYPNNVQHVLGPWFSFISADTGLFYWHADAKQIRLWQNYKELTCYRFGCEIMPINKSNSDTWFPCYLDRSSTNILLLMGPSYDNDFTGCKHTIQETIDSISSFYDITNSSVVIVTWSVETKASSVYYTELTNGTVSIKKYFQWVTGARISWYSKECSIPFLFNYTLKPVDVGGDDEERFLFLIEDNNEKNDTYRPLSQRID